MWLWLIIEVVMAGADDVFWVMRYIILLVVILFYYDIYIILLY